MNPPENTALKKPTLIRVKTFYNGRKIPTIPSLLNNSRLECGFKIKAKYFKNLFVSQSTSLVNNNKLREKSTFNSIARLKFN